MACFINRSARSQRDGPVSVSEIYNVIVSRRKRQQESDELLLRRWGYGAGGMAVDDDERDEGDASQDLRLLDDDFYFRDLGNDNRRCSADDVAAKSISLASKRDVSQRATIRQQLRADGRLSWANYQAALKLLEDSKHCHNIEFPYLHDWRWEVITGVSQNTVVGRGDLVFTDGEGTFAIVQLGMYSGEMNEPKKFFVRDGLWKNRTLRYARIFERLHPGTSVVPMLQTGSGILQYLNGEWRAIYNERSKPTPEPLPNLGRACAKGTWDPDNRNHQFLPAS